MLTVLAFLDADAFARIFRLWAEWHGAWRFLLVFGVMLGLAWLLKTILFKALDRLAGSTSTDLDDTLIGALRWPARYWVVLLALVIAVADLDERDVPARIAHGFSQTILILFVISMALAISRVSIVLLQHSMRRSATGIQITTLTRTLIRVFWFVPAALIILRQAFSFEITPWLATLGVGGIAISLALKDTLANVFSGFYVSLSGQLHKGDYIRLQDPAVEGYVSDIHWRVTTLKTLSNNLVLIPNSKLSEAVLTNLSQPAKQLSVAITYGVDYATDLDLLDRVVIEEVQAAVGQIPGLLALPEPSNRLNPGFGDSSLNFTLSIGVTEVEAQFAVTDLLRRRLLKRFRAEGIRMPFPMRTVEILRDPNAPGSAA
jgi:small-conductance mechanosensitive channel